MMELPFSALGALLGGLGLFLLAVGMMTEGLRLAAGNSLRKLLAEWTQTPFRGVMSGFFMTAIVQSSSAVNVASIGFVNAGLISMRQALGVIYGSNIGTTITGWLVALVGFKLNIQAFALPLIGVGMMLRLFRPQERLASAGMALVGFGLFFLGVDILKEAFEGLVERFDIASYSAQGLKGIVLYLGIGIVMTMLTQSSSASIALTITAAVSGIIELNAAAAMVIGANVGTTSTAVIASIGATANAKRVALAQVMFNLGTGLVALFILPIMFGVINFVGGLLGLSVDIGLAIALFHTIFNILGVLLVFPLNDRLVAFLENRFVAREETLSLPKYLDKTIAATPVLAVNALVMELESVAAHVRNLGLKSIGGVHVQPQSGHSDLLIIRNLSLTVSKFVRSLERKAFSAETSTQLATVLRIDQYLLGCANNIEQASLQLHAQTASFSPPIADTLVDFRKASLTVLELLAEDYDDSLLADLQTKHDVSKALFLREGLEENSNFEEILQAIDLLAILLKLSQQWLKALRFLKQLKLETGTPDKADIEPVEVQSDSEVERITHNQHQ